jgi:hypothetical protein
LWHKILLWHFVAFLKSKNATKLPLVFARLCKFDKRLSILDKFIDIINKTEKMTQKWAIFESNPFRCKIMVTKWAIFVFGVDIQ